MVEPAVSGFFADLIFQLVHRTRRLDGLDFSAARADQVIAVLARLEQGEIRGPLVETQPAKDAVLAEPLQQTIDRGLVALVGKTVGGRKLGQRHRAIPLHKCREKFLERLGAAEPAFAATCHSLFDRILLHVF